MCRILAKIFLTCGHARKTIIGNPCPHSTACLSHSNSQHNERVYIRDRDCGSGGAFMTCWQRNLLNEPQTRLLQACKQRAKTAWARYDAHTSLIDHHIQNNAPASIRYSALVKAVEAEERALENLTKACRECGQSIMADGKVARQGEDDLAVVERHSAAIVRWFEEDFPLLNAAVRELDRAENVQGGQHMEGNDGVDMEALEKLMNRVSVNEENSDVDSLAEMMNGFSILGDD